MIDRTTPDWYKDAVIYQLHIKAFFDANNDGIGDFAGLIQKLDYVKSLGVTAIWLLPFYPSPLRDDGYDIADYRDVNPAYGTLRDFRRLVRECHKRDLRVITELVINHTSDQHPWFQKARRAKKGSKTRDFYVWSDSDQAYQDTRIIFLDTESSNWAWDPVAQQYYWHRFYSHQPDLNFDNPRVLQEIMRVLHFWLKAGVDGMRLDAVPYLIEREGTNNENLPETHAILKRIRDEVDAHYPDRMLLAEANQWPEDTAEYFGTGDECHMAFHFPLMPRMYMAVAQEDRHPITDILRQTPELPEGCQWAIFLRNHDELTLEMVTDKERDYLWDVYAADRRMRINLGIRRRLAPLMERDRAKIQLLYGLLLSMPGTPVLYYGDEIGMGDNIYLGDRDGVRTPMQWTPDRNGGFSRANPAKLYLPPVQDPVYGYGALNVESQEADKSSMLNWMKRMLRVRQSTPVFGRGSLTFLYPGNRKIFAYLREYAGETVLCVANLARTAQAVELDLSRWAGRVPVELMDRTAFPPIGDLFYLLTLPGHAFYWFTLADRAAMPDWHTDLPETIPEFLPLVLRRSLAEAADGKNREMLEGEILPAYLPNHRWFAGKDRPIDGVAIETAVPLGGGAGGDGYLGLVIAVTQGESREPYFLPLTVAWNEEALHPAAPTLAYTLAKARRFRTIGAVQDAAVDDAFARSLLALMRGEGAGDPGLVGEAFEGLAELDLGTEATVRRLGGEQSNTSIVVGDAAVLKIYRHLVRGVHPELEIVRYLTREAGFANTPDLLGSLALTEDNGETMALAIAQRLVFNEGDGWRVILNYLDAELEDRQFEREQGETPEAAPFEANLTLIDRLGQRTAEMHRAFARETHDPAFRPEPVTPTDVTAWRDSAKTQIDRAIAALSRIAERTDHPLAERAKALIAEREALIARLDTLAEAAGETLKTRTHGDYHLGQVLVSERDFYIIDFEGEPSKTIAERRKKTSPLRDVAGLIRSFDYAACAGAMQLTERLPDAAETARVDALTWREAATARFLTAYLAHLGDCGVWPADGDAGKPLLTLFALEKAAYEIAYEAANRPDWLAIPLDGLERAARGDLPLDGDI